MTPKPRSIISLLNDVKNGNVALPDLQRDFVWSESQIRLLLDSIMRGYPFGLLLFWETQFLEVVYREFVTDYTPGQNAVTKEKPKGKSMQMVLDGQQRLQSLYVAVFGSYDGRRLYFNVTSGPKGANQPSEEDPIGRAYRFEFWRDDQPNRPNRLVRVADVMRWPLQHEKDEIRKLNAAIGLTGDEADIAEDNLKLLRAVMREEIIPVEVIDENVYEADQATSIEQILEIFVRVNSGGTKLTRSDLMFSLIKTKWVAARSRFDALLSDIAKLGGLGVDKDFLILALLTISDVPIDVDVAVIQRHWDAMEPNFPVLESALKSAIDFCQSTDGGRILAAKLLKTNVLLPLTYYLSKQPKGSVPDDQRQPLRALLYFVLFNEFLGGRSPYARVRYLREAFQKNPGASVPLDALLAEMARRQRHTSITTTIDMLNWNKACALNIAQPTAARDTLSWQEEPQIDHIFPQSTYRPIHGDAVDDIGNLAYLGRLRNIRKNDEPPWEYFKNVSDAELRDDFLIEDRSLLAHERFGEFVEKRRPLIVARVKQFLGR
jgi:hypothetical protein